MGLKFKYLYPLLFTSLFASCQENSSIKEETSPTDSVDVVPDMPTELVVDTNIYAYAWQSEYNYDRALLNLIPPPEGYKRTHQEKNSFGDWLRHLPLKEDNVVYLYDGSKKYNQSAQYAVVDIDIGKRDLQQCADAVMRLRAEYLYTNDRKNDIAFNYTNGVTIPYSKWSSGLYPKVSGSRVNWVSSSNSDSYSSFKKYMTNIFMYAGTASLSKELKKIELVEILPGDVFIWGGFPGHAVIVLDVARNRETGDTCFLLAQSYMPAQNIHVLKNPINDSMSPWYSLKDIKNEVNTPEWTFEINALSRFEE